MTYSIIAKCSETGQYGVGIQSHFYAAGNACWANAGVGAVVTQAMALIDHGPLGLKLMAEGKSASEALTERLALDSDSEIRQGKSGCTHRISHYTSRGPCYGRRFLLPSEPYVERYSTSRNG